MKNLSYGSMKSQYFFSVSPNYWSISPKTGNFLYSEMKRWMSNIIRIKLKIKAWLFLPEELVNHGQGPLQSSSFSLLWDFPRKRRDPAREGVLQWRSAVPSRYCWATGFELDWVYLPRLCFLLGAIERTE